MGNVYFEKTDDYYIRDDENVKVNIFLNANRVEIRNSSNQSNNLLKFKKIKDNKFVDIETGEIRQYKINEHKSEESLKKSLKKAKLILQNNFFGRKNELFITLTYADLTYDIDAINRDFKNFWKKLKRRNKNLEYFYVIEFQNRNCAHMHLLIKDMSGKSLFIEEQEIRKLWGKGYIFVEKTNKRIIEEYFYFDYSKSNIENLIDYMVKEETKEMIPSNKKVYSKSRGIVAPKTVTMKSGEAEKMLNEKNYVLINQKAFMVKSENGNTLNTIKIKSYKLKK